MKPTNRNIRWLYLGLAYVLTGLAAIGVVVPLFPTTPFLIAAAWSAARGSERFHHALVTNRYFGPMIRDWETQHAISRKAKSRALACSSRVGSRILLFSGNVIIPPLTAALFITVATYMVTRPTPRSTTSRT